MGYQVIDFDGALVGTDSTNLSFHIQDGVQRCYGFVVALLDLSIDAIRPSGWWMNTSLYGSPTQTYDDLLQTLNSTVGIVNGREVVVSFALVDGNIKVSADQLAIRIEPFYFEYTGRDIGYTLPDGVTPYPIGGDRGISPTERIVFYSAQYPTNCYHLLSTLNKFKGIHQPVD